MTRLQLGSTILTLFLTCGVGGLSSNADNPPAEVDRNPVTKQDHVKPDPASKPKQAWKTLTGKWELCQFGGDGEISIKETDITIEMGDPLTGVYWKGDVLRDNYELKMQARRTDGFDFFCGLTFPIAKNHVTLVLGGWGGGVTGISSIDGLDASENETTMFADYKNDKWYDIRVRVDPFGITCWVDDDVVVEVARADKEFGLRFEMELCEPLGMAAYQCDAEYRKVQVRKLTAKELKAAEVKKKEWADE